MTQEPDHRPERAGAGISGRAVAAIAVAMLALIICLFAVARWVL